MTASTSTPRQINNGLTTSQVVDLPADVHQPQNQQVSTLAKVELVRASTPLMLAAVGCVIGLFTLFMKPDADVKTAGLNLAGTAIAGAAGLAQSHNRQD